MMALRQQLRGIVTGIRIAQEYVCLGLEDLREPLRVHLTQAGSDRAIDVTATHLFVGYHPLIIALPATVSAAATQICLSFDRDAFHPDTTWRGMPASRASIARIALRRIGESNLGATCVDFYRGELGQHHLIGPLHRVANDALERLRKRPPGNVSLEGNLYDQVRIAYALPRLISLVTVSDDTLMNMFPTDLHGPIGAEHYLGSLRLGGRACEQVERARRIVISEVAATDHRAVYALGKNHMRALADRREFALHEVPSATLHVPLPRSVLRYRELEWQTYFEEGIHRIYCYRVLHSAAISTGPTLAHVHQYYAQWRNNLGLRTEYLLR